MTLGCMSWLMLSASLLSRLSGRCLLHHPRETCDETGRGCCSPPWRLSPIYLTSPMLEGGRALCYASTMHCMSKVTLLRPCHFCNADTVVSPPFSIDIDLG